MIRRLLPATVPLLLLALTACDNEGTVPIVPELEESFDFESSLEGWTARSGNLPVGTDVEVARATGGGSAGQGWVRITTGAEEPGGRVWIERAFQVTPEESYEVTVRHALGTADGPSTAPWELVSGAGPEPPTGGGLVVQGNTAPDSPQGSLVWEPREHTLVLFSGPAEAGEESATVWIALGIGIPTADDREYGLDEIEISFLRN